VKKPCRGKSGIFLFLFSFFLFLFFSFLLFSLILIFGDAFYFALFLVELNRGKDLWEVSEEALQEKRKKGGILIFVVFDFLFFESTHTSKREMALSTSSAPPISRMECMLN